MKGNLLQGTARGKMGDIVAKVVHGEQILAKYQPIVFNPNSEKQQIVRNTFALAAKRIKENRDELKLLNLFPRYQLPSGASKNIRNFVVPYAFRIAKILEAGGNSMALTSGNPTTLLDSPTGQTWGVTLDPLGNTIQPIPNNVGPTGNGFFGSDIYLAEGEPVVSQFAPSVAGLVQGVSVHQNTLTLQDRTTAIGLPKAMGTFATIEECGEWNYIYSWALGEPITQVGEPIPYQGSTEQTGLMVFLLDNKSTIITAQSVVDLP